MQRLYQPATPDELSRRKAFHANLNVQMRSTVGLKDAEQWNNIFPEWSPNNTSNISITSAQKLSIVFTCLNVLGETRGSLPCEVKKNTSKGRVTVANNNIYRLVHDRPNPMTTAFDFWSTVEKLKKAWGNAFVEIERYSSGEPKYLWIRLPWAITWTFTPEGDLYYLFNGRAIRTTDMLHFKNFSMDGFCGVSTIKQNALSIGMGLKLKEYNSNIITDRPPGFLTTETKPKDLTAKANMESMWSRKNDTNQVNTIASPVNATTIQSGTVLRIPILYGGVKYEQLSLPADDVAYIESTNLTNTDIYGIFRMPPTFGQEWKNTPYNGAEQQDLIFAKYTLASIRGDEQEMTEKLFPESNKTAEDSLYIKFNLKGLLAGDHASRQKFYTALFNIGALNANEIREMEDLPHQEDGGTYFVQGALVPMHKMDELIDAKIESGNKQDPKDPAEEPAAKREAIMEEIRHALKGRLNGHYKEIEDILQ